MATPRKYLDDGIVQGHVKAQQYQCEACEEHAWCVEIVRVEVSKLSIEPNPRLIAFELADYDGSPHPIQYLGITCGCYARFHRQLAHIQDRNKE